MRSKSTARRLAQDSDLDLSPHFDLEISNPLGYDEMSAPVEATDVTPEFHIAMVTPSPLPGYLQDPPSVAVPDSTTPSLEIFSRSRSTEIETMTLTNNTEILKIPAFTCSREDHLRDSIRSGADNSESVIPVPRELQLQNGRDGKSHIHARVAIEAGAQFGPIINSAQSAGSNCENKPGQDSWMTLIRPSQDTEASNLMAVHIQNQLYYQAIREIQAGEEMLLYNKDKLHQEPSAADAYTAPIEDDEILPCGQCGEIFKTKIMLQRHVAFGCSGARSMFPEYSRQFSRSEEDLNRTVDCAPSPEFDHDDQGEFRCEECPRSFSLKSNLARHMITHESGRRFSCEHCDRYFTDPSNLQRHIRSQHHGARCHACTDCGKTFATSSGLKQHQHIHSSVKPFQCEVCLKAYTQFSNLCRHKRMHADCRQQIKCNDCGQAFSTLTSLSKHKRFCEGVLRSGMRLGGYSAEMKLSPHAGMSALSPPGPTTPFNPAMMMSLYGARPAFPFYPPMGANFPLFPAGHPLAALTSPCHLRSPGLQMTPEKREMEAMTVLTSSGRFHRNSEGSDGGSEQLSGSDLDNIPSDTESERSTEHLSMSEDVNMTLPIAQPAVTPTLMSPQIPKPVELNYTIPESKRIQESKLLPVTEIEESDVPFDLSKPCKEEQQITPKASPSQKAETPTSELPLDLSRTKNLSPPEAPRKTHIFGEVKTPTSAISSEPRLHYAYPQFSSQLLMEKAQRMTNENTEKQTESTSFLPYRRFPFSSPTQYPGVNPFGFVNRETPKTLPMLPSLSPQTKPLQFSPSPYPVPTHYTSPVKLGAKDRYSCKFCGKIFPRSANLTRHLRTHTGEQPYKCKHCERSFSISSNLQRHVRNIHNKEKPFRCALCDRCFGQQTNLDRHLKKHETEGLNVVDSPDHEPELEDKDESYFAEIRNFIGKATEGDINQNSLLLGDMKMKADHVDRNESDDEMELNVVDTEKTDIPDVPKVDVEHGAENGEPVIKRSRLSEPFYMNGYHSNTEPLPLCQKPGFELKRGFSPLLCSS